MITVLTIISSYGAECGDCCFLCLGSVDGHDCI